MTASGQPVRTCRAAILQQSSAPLVVDEITLPESLAPGQVLVRITLSGVCGAQINEIDAVKGPDRFLPHLLGHEGYGEVMDVGPLVRSVAPGQWVVLHWMPGAGVQADPAGYRWRGQRLNAGWVTTLSEFTVISENRCTPVTTSVPLEYLPLLGCAATTAAGVIGRDAQVRLGESVVVLGTGGVGLLTVEAARASGAHPIIGVDRVAERLSAADAMGATATVLTSAAPPATEATEATEGRIRTALGGAPPDVVIETTGAREMIELACRLVAHGGRTVLVGVPRHDEPASVDTLPLHFDTIWTGSKGGGTQPQHDIPRLLRLAEAGLFRLTGLPVTRFPLAEVNDAIELVRTGLPGRAVVDPWAG